MNELDDLDDDDDDEDVDLDNVLDSKDGPAIKEIRVTEVAALRKSESYKDHMKVRLCRNIFIDHYVLEIFKLYVYRYIHSACMKL